MRASDTTVSLTRAAAERVGGLADLVEDAAELDAGTADVLAGAGLRESGR